MVILARWKFWRLRHWGSSCTGPEEAVGRGMPGAHQLCREACYAERGLAHSVFALITKCHAIYFCLFFEMVFCCSSGFPGICSVDLELKDPPASTSWELALKARYALPCSVLHTVYLKYSASEYTHTVNSGLPLSDSESLGAVLYGLCVICKDMALPTATYKKEGGREEERKKGRISLGLCPKLYHLKK